MTTSDNTQRPSANSARQGSRREARPARGRQRPSAGDRRPLQGRDTGYRVRNTTTGVNGRRPINLPFGLSRQTLIFGAIGIIVLIILLVGISSCVRSCTGAANQDAQQEQQVNAQDSRVAAGASQELTSKLSPQLDRAEALKKIAKNADKYKDQRLIDLALSEPEAIEFVAGALKAKASASTYDDTLTKGSYPLIYTFDSRWGYAKYADATLGTLGSGPLSLSIVSMGLSGKTTNDPAAVAEAITAAKLATGSTGMDDTFVKQHLASIGLASYDLTVSSDSLAEVITATTPVLIKVKSGSSIGSANAHWALVTAYNEDGSYSIIDPTSAIASSHTWAGGSISGASEAFYGLYANEEASDDESDDTSVGTVGLSGSTSQDTGSTEEYYDEEYSE